MTRLLEALTGHRETVVQSWGHRFDRAAMRGPGARRAREHAALVGGLVEALAVVVNAGVDHLRPGASAARDLEKATAFAGASLAAAGASGFEVAALTLSLRDAVLEHCDHELAGPVEEMFEWLTILALDAYATAGRGAVAERAAEQLEAGTPVLLLTPDIPAVMLVGAPPEDVLDSILARAMLLVVRVGAASLVLDMSGLADIEAAPVEAAMCRLLAHRRMPSVELLLVGAAPALVDRWRTRAGVRDVVVRDFDRFDAAFGHAMRRVKRADG